jgi:peptidoglycan/LPS O-acetylase OafA/YrhL
LTQKPTGNANNRLLALDGLRGLACAGIVLLHVWMYDHGAPHGGGQKNVLDLVIGELRLGVPLFFVLSGFLVYRPFVAAALDGRGGPSLRTYALRRAARVLPAYWAAVIGAFVLLRVLDHPYRVPAGQLPTFLLFAQNQDPSVVNHLDPPLWTLCVEVTFYLLVPLVGLLALRLGRRRGRQLALAGALTLLGAALVAAAALGHWPRTTTSSLVTNLTSFAAGMYAAVLVHRRELSRTTALALLAAGIALIVGDGVWHAAALGAQQVRDVGADQPAAIGFALVIAAFAGSSLRAGPLATAPLTTMGTLSYAAYLWHFPMIYALRQLGAWPGNLALAFAATMAVTCAIALASWRLLEQPIIRLAHRTTQRRRWRSATWRRAVIDELPVR